MGLMPARLEVLPDRRVLAEGQPVATVADNRPYENVTPFGLCNSLANPNTASQTSAAQGVLTPGACAPVLPAPWGPGSPTVLVGNVPMLTHVSQCTCAYGGIVTVVNPGTTRESVP
jgi:hypothetical protein